MEVGTTFIESRRLGIWEVHKTVIESLLDKIDKKFLTFAELGSYCSILGCATEWEELNLT